jgi:hypothetical protein
MPRQSREPQTAIKVTKLGQIQIELMSHLEKNEVRTSIIRGLGDDIDFIELDTIAEQENADGGFRIYDQTVIIPSKGDITIIIIAKVEKYVGIKTYGADTRIATDKGIVPIK